MLVTILPLVFFTFLLLVVENLYSQNNWPRAFIRASILWASYAILTLEILSLFSSISRRSLSLAWLFPSIGLGMVLLRIHNHRKTIHLPTIFLPENLIDRILLCAIALTLLITLMVAWIAPPQTADSYVYHMSRVAHWAQNESIRPYITGIRFQNTMSQAAELIILHFYILAGSDSLVNLVQWFAMAGSLIGVYLVVSQLGGRRTGQFFAVAYAASLPMGIIQASSTMTDYVVTFWMICTVSEGLYLVQDHTRLVNTLFLGLAIGLAIATKPTSFAFLLPFAILIPFMLYRRIAPRSFLLTILCILLSVFILNFGHYTRNFILYGNPLGHEGTIQRHANEQINAKSILLNTIRHASLHAGTPWPDVNEWIYKQIVKVHVKLDQDINDPKTTFTEFRILTPSTNENTVINPIHSYLILLGFILAIIKRSMIKSMTIRYGVTVAAGFIVFSALFKYQIFGSRLQLPFFVLIAPFMGIVISEIVRRNWISSIGILLILFSYPWLFQISSRSIIPKSEEGNATNIFFNSRESLYFAETQGRITSYKMIANRIEDHDCNKVGVFLSGSSSEYLWWVVLDAPKKGIQIEWIVSDSPTAKYEDPNFQPCAIICENCPGDWEKIRGLPLVPDINNQFKLFLDSEQ